MRKLGLTLLILWLVGCSAVQVPQGPSRVTWPVPSLPAPLDPAPTYQAGWFNPSVGSGASCLPGADYHRLGEWIKAHLKREVELEGQVRESQQTITTINGLVPH